MELMKIVQRGTMHARVTLPERWLDRVQVGQPVTLTAAHRPEPLTGRVITVSKLAIAGDDDPKGPRSFTVVVKLDRDPPELKPNMSCRAQVEVAHHRAVQKLPVDLVRTRSGSGVTFRAKDGRELAAKLVDEDLDHVYVSGLPDGAELMY
jgi:hypothetical protein